MKPDALHLVPLRIFVAKPPVDDATVARYFDHFAPGWSERIGIWRRRGLDRELPSPVPGYSLRVKGRTMRSACAYFVENATGSVGGAIDHFNFYVWPVHRGKGLGIELLDLAFRTGIKTMEVTEGHALSAGGLACRRAVHRRFVERALQEGLDVPGQVLEDYPDLWQPVISTP